jgi:hypothetical protein
VDRLKQSVEMKDVTLEEMASKVGSLERDRKKLTRDLEAWTSEQVNDLFKMMGFANCRLETYKPNQNLIFFH